MTPTPGAERSRWGAVWTVTVIAAVLGLAVVRYRPPTPLPETADTNRFSAGRAMEHLRGLVGDGTPRPVGSASNARAREWLVETLTEMGLAPQVHEGGAAHFDLAADVHNVIARLPAADDDDEEPVIALMAHYDSVAAGPGASDDGVGVAALLETARALTDDGPGRNPVVLVFTDGEEAGLLGAKALNAHPDRLGELAVVVNVEARGTSGPSLLFETGYNNEWLIDLFAEHADRPVTGSAFTWVYDRMPNSTDFAVWKEDWIPGVNLAFIGGGARYHTPRDDLEHVTAGSLQHHGDNVLALARALRDTDLTSPPGGNAVFFDVLALGIVHWPVRATPWLLGTAVLVMIVTALVCARCHGLRPRQVLWGALLPPCTLLPAAALAWGLFETVEIASGGLPDFPVRQWPLLAATGCAAWAAAAWPAWELAKRAGPWGAFVGTWAWGALAAAALGTAVPEISYPLVAPALATGVVALVASAWCRGTVGARVAVLFGVASTLCTWAAILLFLPDALGSGIPPAYFAPTVVVVAAAMPAASFCARASWVRVAWGALAASLVTAVLAATDPPYTEDSPQPVSIRFSQQGSDGPASITVHAHGRGVPATLAEMLSEPPPSAGLPPPVLEVEPTASMPGDTRLIGHMRSRRGATVLTLFVAAGTVRRVFLGSVPVTPRNGVLPGPDGGPAQMFTGLTGGPDGVSVDIQFFGRPPFTVYVRDRTYDLPAAASHIRDARPAYAVPAHRGDTTEVWTVVELK